ncbi:DUF5615 family PIN-like protein [Nocardioides sp. ChNu-153]|uniref:DUF5615 family PIN-like protein n=1 Tax=Nocardioides sp. ChNu-153 TaxID=2779364 RepID=UPI00264FD43E|nr:DUF5615 family PIN-like protein [Nocardioides sp. ChNu-153]MDN7120324.1 DUF5615 family PIN-like protein [Nocardioides sp. ChNu-153]
MRFVLDEDVDVRLVGLLHKAGHEAWSINDSGLAGEPDDDVSVYADTHGAAVLTHDVAFSARRRRNPIGRHVQLACKERAAIDLVSQHLDHLVKMLNISQDIFVYLSADGIRVHLDWE